jgi:multidrug transporter EmrE-like cation transporter
MRYRTLVPIFFLTNGLVMITQKAVSEIGSPAAVPMAVLFMQIAAVVPAIIAVLLARRPFDRTSLWVGALGGLGGTIGTVFVCLAARQLPGYIVFPISGGGNLLLVALIARIAFKEKIGPYGIAGIAVGIAAIALLSV